MHIWEAWNSPLCHIISQDFAPDLRSRSKEMLKGITGGRQATYRQVRDRLAQFMELHSYCDSPLQAAIFVREKAQQCGPQWILSNVTRKPSSLEVCLRSPICLLLWMACSVPESSQVNLLSLTDGVFGKLVQRQSGCLVPPLPMLRISMK